MRINRTNPEQPAAQPVQSHAPLKAQTEVNGFELPEQEIPKENQKEPTKAAKPPKPKKEKPAKKPRRQPVEEVARTGMDALRYGALKPVGLTDPRTDRRPWAAVQLRAENAQATAYNLVGFQTNLRFGEQERVFRMIPGLEHAEFSRFGVMHRNTFVDTPHVLTRTLALPRHPQVHLAGQVTGTEGYLEAVASGLFVALAVYAELAGLAAPCLPKHSFIGALFDYATDPETQDYQPMHVNHGILEPIEPKIKNKQQRQAANAKRGLDALEGYVAQRCDLFADAGAVAPADGCGQ